MGKDVCDGDGHIIAVASLRTALVQFAEESTEKLLEEDWRGGGIWTIIMIVSGSGRFDDDSDGLLRIA